MPVVRVFETEARRGVSGPELCALLEAESISETDPSAGERSSGGWSGKSVDTFNWDRLGSSAPAPSELPHAESRSVAPLDGEKWPLAILATCASSLEGERDCLFALAVPGRSSIVLVFAEDEDGQPGKQKVRVLRQVQRGEAGTQTSLEEISALGVLATPVKIVGCPFVVLVGYTTGRLRMFSPDGRVLLTQRLCRAPVTRIQFRGAVGDISQTDADIAIVFEGGIIASIEGRSLFAALCSQVGGGDGAVPATSNTLSYRIFKLRSQRVADAVPIACSSPSSPQGLLHPLDTAQCRVVSVGSLPIVGFFEATAKESRLLKTAAFISVAASVVARKVVSTAMSFARSWWGPPPPSPDSVEGEEGGEEEHVDDHISPPVAISAPIWISDADRMLTSLTLDPLLGRFILCPDNLGRVVLVDCSSFTIAKIWKGYRDAQVTWLVSRQNVIPPHSKRRRPVEAAESTQLAIFAVLYAPLRGIVEVWYRGRGIGVWHRACIHETAIGGRLVPPPFNLGVDVTAEEIPPFLSRCFILHPSGDKTVIDATDPEDD